MEHWDGSSVAVLASPVYIVDINFILFFLFSLPVIKTCFYPKNKSYFV